MLFYTTHFFTERCTILFLTRISISDFESQISSKESFIVYHCHIMSVVAPTPAAGCLLWRLRRGKLLFLICFKSLFPLNQNICIGNTSIVVALSMILYVSDVWNHITAQRTMLKKPQKEIKDLTWYWRHIFLILFGILFTNFCLLHSVP